MAFSRLAYWRRLTDNYILRRRSHLAFWHEVPETNPHAPVDSLGGYFMSFADKADYAGPFDARGVPLLDYGGKIGPQYNPIAIAQYGLAQWNAQLNGREGSEERLLRQADWLVDHLEPNERGYDVWMHHFDWEYASGLRSPWYSGLAQGQGVSCLLRAHKATGDMRYRAAATRAFRAMVTDVTKGGVLEREGGGVWIEEYLTRPASHIVNGFMWALWGVWDMTLVKEPGARQLWNAGVSTLAGDLPRFDTGYWSLYDLYPARGRCVASPFYHRLHIVQLDVMHRLTGDGTFAQVRDRWRVYQERAWNRRRALAAKVLFKAVNY
ncbi:MAG: D-glucuronyl C5-epimerase family protein [Thermoplasmatota archaeon]